MDLALVTTVPRVVVEVGVVVATPDKAEDTTVAVKEEVTKQIIINCGHEDKIKN